MKPTARRVARQQVREDVLQPGMWVHWHEPDPWELGRILVVDRFDLTIRLTGGRLVGVKRWSVYRAPELETAA